MVGFEPELVDYVTLIEEAVGLERETAFRKLTSEQLRDAARRLRIVADHLAEELHIRWDPARPSLPAAKKDPISAATFVRHARHPGAGSSR